MKSTEKNRLMPATPNSLVIDFLVEAQRSAPQQKLLEWYFISRRNPGKISVIHREIVETVRDALEEMRKPL